MSLSQMTLVADILRAIVKQGVKNVSVKQMNAVIEGATLIVTKFDLPHVPAVPGMGLAAWAYTDDVGVSSKYIATVLGSRWMFGSDTEDILRRKDHPHDADDFGRCSKLLKSVPEFAGRMEEVAAAGGPVWTALVANWDDLEWRHQVDVVQGTNLCTPKIRELVDGAK